MGERSRIDDIELDTPVPVFGHAAKVTIATLVFMLGVLVGVGLAAWIVPPS
jgi:hypothetical protein